MKTDRFADIIRRKLDSIRPDFSERDWARMQATLKQAGPSPNAPTPSAHPFASQAARFAVAGAVGTTIFLTTTIWQHYELKHLHQTLQQVTQKANRLETAQPDAAHITQPATESEAVTSESNPRNQKSETSVDAAPERNSVTLKRDTVYIDRYVTVPAPATRLRPTESSQLTKQPERTSTGNQVAKTDFSSSTERVGSTTRNRTTNQPENRIAEPISTGSRPRVEVTHPEKSAENVAIADRPTKGRDRVSGSYTNVEHTNQTSTREVTNGNVTTPSSSNNQVVQNQPVSSDIPPVISTGETTQPTFAYESLAALPMQTNTVRWDALLAQRARQMRPARTAVTVVSGQPTTAPTSQRVQSIPLRLRAGIGTDINSEMWSMGVYTELLASKHWSLGLGLSQATFATAAFRSPLEFDKNIPQDFRKQYARGLDPRLDIFGIEMYTVRVQLPISLGYRIPLSQSFTLLPTIGTSLNLQSQQYISFYHQLPYWKGYEKFQDRSIRPVDLFNNMTFGASLEWQNKHWAIQAGPVISTPLQSDPGCQQDATVGLRARLFYQF
ncbi:hypothetical protein [Spirosoma endbachense]|uniref:Uncharacterized protein n=1 Tax=Spirosoma endbachense TaxID=2666025 RepID=A0A6P1VRF8_9BACT|nr:hypothetical protein [Spirosoma endbachense]QHV94692.1 hypothetical protein GJR95_06550 [Spirosoma endbachense]